MVTFKPRSLEQVCEEADFHVTANANTYCKLALSRRVECPHLAKTYDHNGLYACTNPRYKEVFAPEELRAILKA